MRLLILEARYYEDISNQLKAGAQQALARAKVAADFITLKGALEIPPAIKVASGSSKYNGYVALGCVIRGETSHYDIVSMLSAKGLMDLGTREGLAIGNGILTVENREQALERAHLDKGNKGGFAVDACLALLALRSE